MSLITIHTYQNATEAHLMRSLLESEGIHCYLADEHLSSLVPHYNHLLGGIKLQTHESNAVRAKEILHRAEGANLSCPHCGSEKVMAHTTSFKGLKGKISLLISFLLLIFPFYYQQGHRCQNCGKDFSIKL